MSLLITTPRMAGVSGVLGRPDALVAFRLRERNRVALDVISSYANKHAAIDVVVGIAGTFIPFMAIPALAGSIALQAPVIYQPMASHLASVYLARPQEIKTATASVVMPLAAATGLLDMASEFGQEFMVHIARELIVEVGLGALAALAVPVIGGAVGAALDYLIATQMTWRVGTMVSAYFQNGGAWIGDKQHTFELAKQMTGGIRVGVNDLLSGKFKSQIPRVDLDTLRDEIPSVRHNLVRNLSSFVEMMRGAMEDDQVRQILIAQGVPADLIAAAIGGRSRS